ncbi:hypothetical protein K1719_019719 [Acacia pycnantha]|nr:hypothetical protein K1719_019719 [Acacia pycnantha]
MCFNQNDRLKNDQIRFILLQNRQGKARLAKYYVPLEESEKHKVEYEVHRLVVNRDPKLRISLRSILVFLGLVFLVVRNCREDHPGIGFSGEEKRIDELERGGRREGAYGGVVQ